MIFITGDCHGNWKTAFSKANFPVKEYMSKERGDLVIVCGDFGIWNNSSQEKAALDWLAAQPFYVAFVDGNHENFDMLNAMKTEYWNGGKVNFIRDSVIHLKRGQVFNINGLSFFTFGGARSHDIKDGILDRKDPNFKEKYKMLMANPSALFRINHESWWKEELPSIDECKEGLRNLELHNNKVDYIITHSPSISEQFMYYNSNETDVLMVYLEKILNKVEFKRHFFGHLHMNKSLEYRSYCLYTNFIRVA